MLWLDKREGLAVKFFIVYFATKHGRGVWRWDIQADRQEGRGREEISEWLRHVNWPNYLDWTDWNSPGGVVIFSVYWGVWIWDTCVLANTQISICYCIHLLFHILDQSLTCNSPDEVALAVKRVELIGDPFSYSLLCRYFFQSIIHSPFLGQSSWSHWLIM